MRSRRSGAMHTFDLVDDGEDARDEPGAGVGGRTAVGDGAGRAGKGGGADAMDGAAADPEPAPEPSALDVAVLCVGRSLRRVARDPRRFLPRSRAARVALAGGLVSVVAAVSAGMTVHRLAEQDARHALLATAPGGVVSLERPPVSRWSAGTYAAEDLPVVVPGAIVTVNGGMVTAIDVATGNPRWEAEVPEGTECGPAPDAGAGPSAQVEAALPLDRIVCVTGGPEPSVTVLAPDGTVVAIRDLDPWPGTYHPAADGGLLYVDRVEPALEPLIVAGTTAGDVWDGFVQLEDWSVLPPGWAGQAGTRPRVSVAMLDAVTGDTRWEYELMNRGWDPAFCADVTVQGDTLSVDVGVVTVTSTPTLVSVMTCGAGAVVTPDGTPLDRYDYPLARPDRAGIGQQMFGAQTLEPYADGGYVRRIPDAETLLDIDGNEVLTAWSGATLLNPLSTDGDHRDLILTSGGITLIGQDAAGAEHWRVRAGDVLVVARTADAIVTALPTGELAAYDPATGASLWKGIRVSGTWAQAFHRSIVSAATDGETVLLALGLEPTQVLQPYNLPAATAWDRAAP
ncbi:hypothetical protein L1785_06325 [Antribacter sp. KLBMP9083]|uniref:Uncharacterized protein n=1 Tax=Antribacter soli TaxID=2910976 RepID=A0AA41U8K9_9MICO|nr:hypothetical protein [Antribacter soli]MCF4120587.1 hypothetical protein [Antribacter soli]